MTYCKTNAEKAFLLFEIWQENSKLFPDINFRKQILISLFFKNYENKSALEYE